MKIYHLLCCLFFAGAVSSQAQSLARTITKIPDEIHDRAAQAVVKIIVGERQRLGAGIIIGKTRNGAPIILTSNVLITGFETQLTVQLEQATSAVPAQIITPNWRNRDLVLLATRSPLPGAAPALDYGRSDQVTRGDGVSVLGFPSTSFLSQNSGEVSHVAAEQLQLNFPIAAGQEGGPVLDQKGRVVGIALAGDKEQGAAISIDLTRIVLKEWLGKSSLAESWQEGKDKKRWYGWILGVILISAAGVAIGASGVL